MAPQCSGYVHKTFEFVASKTSFCVAELKCVLYEEGVFWRIKDILAKQDSDDNLACAAVLQNVSEHRFLKGTFFTHFLALYLMFVY